MLILAATPIGNLGDASPRLREALAGAAVIAAEDTRTTSHLIQALGVETNARFVALHDHNESSKANDVVALAAESDVVLVSDAGMPGISDPGYVVVRAAHDAGVTVSAIPGPSAVITALAVSGLPTDRFAFEGFAPRKGQRAFFEQLAREPRTLVFYESPHRLAESLVAARDAFGADRLACVVRELTKMFEEVVRAPLGELVDKFGGDNRGEIVLVVAGAEVVAVPLDVAVNDVFARVASGERLKEASRAVADATGIPARDLYNAALGHSAGA
ncbi:MAG: Ribosomal small subunit methyltransferase [Actinomycetota bacterium]